MLIFSVATDNDDFFPNLKFWQVFLYLSWCAKEGWILWLFLAEQPSYDATWTPTSSWFVFLWHLVKPSRPCARLPRDLQLNKVQRFSLFKVIFPGGAETWGRWKLISSNFADENVIYNERKAIASKYRTRWLQLRFSRWYRASEIAFPIGSMTYKRKCAPPSASGTELNKYIRRFHLIFRRKTFAWQLFADVTNSKNLRIWRSRLFILRDGGMLFPRVFPLRKLPLCAQDILHDKSMRRVQIHVS